MNLQSIQPTKSAQFETLLLDSINRTENINLAIANILLSKLPTDKVCVFGGIFRDYFRNKKSNDVDIIVENQEEYNFFYDQHTRKFVDKFFEELLNIFNFGTLTLTEQPTINNAYDYLGKSTIEDESDEPNEPKQPDGQINMYDQNSTMFKFKVDHIKYNLKLKCSNNSEYSFTLDVSFIKSFDDLKTFAPACFQDSLYLMGYQDVTNFDSFLNIVNTDIKTFCAQKKCVDIISDIKNGIIEICNIDTLKRCQKISRLIYEGLRLKEISDEQLNDVRLKLIKSKQLYRDKLCQNTTTFKLKTIQQRNFYKLINKEFKICNDLNDLNHFKHIVYHLNNDISNSNSNEAIHFDNLSLSSEESSSLSLSNDSNESSNLMTTVNWEHPGKLKGWDYDSSTEGSE